MDRYKNITATRTPHGDMVLVINESILTTLTIATYDAMEKQKADGYKATAEDTKKLWRKLYELSEKGDE